MKTLHTVTKAFASGLAVIAGIALYGSENAHAQSAYINTQYFIVPASTSPNNVMALQNVMAYMLDHNGSVGFINTGFATNPAALNMPNVLRVCQFCSGPSTYFMWDGTNSPTGPFANENGSRFAWAFDVHDTNAFLASSVTFSNWSTDSYNSLKYWGNAATNTADGTLLTFSPTLRGELWTNGAFVASYTNGETIFDHPVTRLTGMICVSYYCASPIDITNDLNYFKGVMEISDFFMVSAPDCSAINSRSSVPFIDPPVVNALTGTASINVEGQRQLGFLYSLERTFDLSSCPINWTLVQSNANEGVYVDAFYPGTNAFYQAIQDK